jgi:hypothetical protein
MYAMFDQSVVYVDNMLLFRDGSNTLIIITVGSGHDIREVLSSLTVLTLPGSS